jgi:hypothetical protein
LLVFEENHFEVLNVYIDIITLLKENVEFHLVTSQEVFTWCKKENLPSNIILTNDYTDRNQLKEIIVNYMQERKISIFLYNTILVGDYKFAGQLLRNIKQSTNSKVILTIHNINSLFSPTILHRNIRIAYQRFKDYLSKILYIHPNVDAYNVLCTNQLSYLKSINNTTKPVFYIPPCIINEKQEVQNKINDKYFAIAIPGGIEKNRRNYESVIAALKVDKSILPQLKLMILGAYNSDYGNVIYTELLELEKDGLNLWVSGNSSSVVSGDLFTSLAAEAAVFLCPTNEETSYEGNKELYGKSKSSGSFYDIVRYKKPAIFPANILLPKEISACTINYKDAADLSNVFAELVKDNSLLNHLNKQVANLHQYFDAETISNQVYEQLSSLL